MPTPYYNAGNINNNSSYMNYSGLLSSNEYNGQFSSPMRTAEGREVKRTLRFGGENCPIEPKIAMLILSYDMTSFRKFLCLSATWHFFVLEAVDEHFKKVECDFVMKYYK